MALGFIEAASIIKDAFDNLFQTREGCWHAGRKVACNDPTLGQGWLCDQAVATLEEYQENL